jgi:hypothetical protein
MSSLLLMVHLLFKLAMILIFKHAAALCLSGIPVDLALTQAESDCCKAKIASKIEKKFTASYTEYSMEQFINFLKDTNIGLSSLTSANIAADAAFRTIQMMTVGDAYSV